MSTERIHKPAFIATTVLLSLPEISKEQLENRKASLRKDGFLPSHLPAVLAILGYLDDIATLLEGGYDRDIIASDIRGRASNLSNSRK